MSEEPAFDLAEPNAVLRGGPLDGEQLHLANRVPIRIEVGEDRCVYRPTAELDTEFPTLAIWAYDHAETA